MENVIYSTTDRKSKVFIVGDNWSSDNAAYVSPYVLANMERLKYSSHKKRASISSNDLPIVHEI